MGLYNGSIGCIEERSQSTSQGSPLEGAPMSSSSDDELDDELMDLGGGAEDAPSGGTKRTMDSSDSDDDSIALSSDDSDDDEAAAAPPKKKKAKAKAKAPPKKKAKAAPKKRVAKKPIVLPEDSDESDDDEAAVNPLDDGYDEDFYGDAADRTRLEGMSAMEREVELTDRRDARERAVERAETQRRLNDAKKAAKRKEEGALARQQSSRTKTLQRGKSASKTQAAIDDLKKQREKDQKKKRQQADSEDEDDEDAEIDESSDEDRSEEEVDSDEEEERRRRQRDAGSSDEDDYAREEEDSRTHTPIEFEDFKSIVVGRNSLEKMVHEPNMAEALCPVDKERNRLGGMFVRVSVGTHEQTGTTTYRVCEITAVTDGSKRYTLGKTKTLRRLKLKFGKSERTFCMDVVSSKACTEEEFYRWQKEMKKEDEEILSKEMSQDRGKNYQKIKARATTEEHILGRQKRLEEAGQDVKDTSRKFQLEAQLQIAQEKVAAGQDEFQQEVDLVSEKIDQVNEAIVEQKSRNADEKTHFWAKINARNKAKMLDAKFRASMDDLQKVTDGRMRTKDDNYWTVEKMKTQAEKDAIAAEEKTEKEAKKVADDAAQQLALELAERDPEDDDDDLGPMSVRAPTEEVTLAEAHKAVRWEEATLDLPSRIVMPPPQVSNTGKKKISLAEYRRRKA